MRLPVCMCLFQASETTLQRLGPTAVFPLISMGGQREVTGRTFNYLPFPSGRHSGEEQEEESTPDSTHRPLPSSSQFTQRCAALLSLFSSRRCRPSLRFISTSRSQAAGSALVEQRSGYEMWWWWKGLWAGKILTSGESDEM